MNKKNGQDKEPDFNYWRVTFEGEDPGPSDDFNLYFADCSYIVGEPLLRNKYIKDLITLIEDYDHYNIIGNIKKIIDDLDEDQTNKNIYALLGILKNGLRVGFLIGNVIVKDMDYWHVAAVWPDEFANWIIKDRDIFNNSLILALDKPSEWVRIDLIIPVIESKRKTVNISY